MKHTKKLLALALVFAMALALAIPAFALTVNEEFSLPELPKVETGNTATANLEDHTFDLYQIFGGTYANDADGNRVLEAITWGSGFAGAEAQKGFLDALKAEGSFDGAFAGIVYDEGRPNVTADAVARVVASWPDLTATEEQYGDGNAKKFADIASQYLANAATEAPVAYGQSVTLPGGYYLVKDVTNVAGVENGVANMFVLQMSAENGGTFAPKVKADVPELVKNVLEVNESTGLKDWGIVADYDVNDHVYFVLTGTLPTDYAEYETYAYTFHDTLSGGLELDVNSFQVTLTNGEDTQPLAGYDLDTAPESGESFTLSFENLKSNAAITSASVIQVVYSAKLTAAALTVDSITNTAHLEFTNDPNPQGNGTPPTGNTPDKVVTVFTFDLDLDKVDGNGNALAGAGFTLYKLVKNGLSDPGEYQEVAVLEKADGKTEFSFEGLDAGDYKLVESEVPTGYNKADDMYFTITATYGDSEKGEDPQSIISLTVGEVKDENGNVIKTSDGENFTITGDVTDKTVSAAIVNLQGVLLPSTGGIGTTIFYVVGGLLLVGAAVVLITKKRLGNVE